MNEGAQEILTLAKSSCFVGKTAMQRRGARVPMIGKALILEVSPAMLGGIEVWGVAGEPLDREPTTMSMEEDLYVLGSMRTASIPKDDDDAAKVSQKVTQEREHLRETD